jgi:uncharacterized protein
MSMTAPSVRYLVLWLTTACNLQCAYCYRRTGEVVQAMPLEVARAALSLASASGLPFHVQLAGGEPTLEPGLIEAVGRMVREARWPATMAVQTNGTMIDASIVDLCRRYDIGIGVSLDGPPHVQERLRGGAAAVFRGLMLLAQAAMPVRVTTVLSSVNVGRLHELALVLARFANIQGLGLDPLVRTGRARDAADLSPRTEAIRSGIRAMSDAIRQINLRRSSPIHWREFDAVRQALSNNGPRRHFCHACTGEALAVHPDGAVYPCGQTIGDQDMAAGTVDAVDWARLRACYHDVLLWGDCGACLLAGRCPGDCPSRLYYNNGTDVPVMCAVYQTIAETLTGREPYTNDPD